MLLLSLHVHVPGDAPSIFHHSHHLSLWLWRSLDCSSCGCSPILSKQVRCQPALHLSLPLARSKKGLCPSTGLLLHQINRTANSLCHLVCVWVLGGVCVFVCLLINHSFYFINRLRQCKCVLGSQGATPLLTDSAARPSPLQACGQVSNKITTETKSDAHTCKYSIIHVTTE